MIRVLFFVSLAVLTGHGLIHLMGFAAYWPLAEIAELPYKSSVAGGRWQLGSGGMRLFSALWLLAAAGFAAGAAGALIGSSWWRPVVLATAALSLIITVLDWENAFRGAIISLVILLAVALLQGLHVTPKPLGGASGMAADRGMVAVPADLPAPVARYYQAISDGPLPMVTAAEFRGRGTLRFNGITFPARLRIVHIPGQAYRHDIEVTYYGRTLMRAKEQLIDGSARLDIPGGVVENDPQIDKAANLALWGQAICYPAVLLSYPGAAWEPVDADTARLVVPSGEGSDSFTVSFDADTGLIAWMEALRFKDEESGMVMWRVTPHGWMEVGGVKVPAATSLTWADEDGPWLAAEYDAVMLNGEVERYVLTGEE